MIRYTAGNLLDSKTDALVNTVNTVGVMGKGIALMFKEAFPENTRAYEAACRDHKVEVGRMFVTKRSDMLGPRWIINFPTKKHWRHPSKLEWVAEGLRDLRRVIIEEGIGSIAIPPLGAGNGGLDWAKVRPLIEAELRDLNIDILVYEPAAKYQNVAKRSGVEKLTPARALIAELVRRYSVLGLDCSLLEVQKLAWFTQVSIDRLALEDPLALKFSAHRYGPYSDQLRHLLDALDGSYLHCDKRIADAGPLDLIWFDDAKRERLDVYLKTTEAQAYRPALEATTQLIDGFESPLGMELLATVDWVVRREGQPATLAAVNEGIAHWPGGEGAAKRKQRIFEPQMVERALERLTERDFLHA